MTEHINASKTPENLAEINQESHNNNLAKAQEKKRRMKEEGLQVERLDHYQKFELNPGSRKLAINAKCWDCSCEQIQEVKYCQVVGCSLHPFRPYKINESHN